MASEFEIQNSLWFDLHRKNHLPIVPNFTPVNYHECDMWSLTKSGYYQEHEIKISKADYKKDAKKIKKHKMLEGKHENAPRQFWYVFPKMLVDEKEIPDYAGLKLWDGFNFEVIINAPFISTKKADDKIIKQAEKCFYWRFWNLRNKFQKKGKTVKKVY